MKVFLIALFAGAFIGVLIKAGIFVLWSRKRHVPAQQSSPMRTYIRVLMAVLMPPAAAGVGYVLAAVYGIFHVVVLEGGLAAGGHAINSSFDGQAVMFIGMAIGAVLGIGAALFFWHHSKPG